MNSFSEIGKEIFENIPTNKQPYWGSLILAEFNLSELTEPKEISDLREIINSNTWEKAHGQFSKIRRLTLKNPSKQLELYLLLAENISKITYNSTGRSAPFDIDSGYWIYPLAMKLAKSLKSKKKRIESKEF